ncbi:MAG: VWA domain containing CoxE-like protein [Methanosaeta sp. PtaU1.Bin028]|nr:MAG: VWA domain containing CoxE-like protein [Methanosaeta sp. PtaU1.Bin028]
MRLESSTQSPAQSDMDTEFFKELDRFSLLVRKKVSTAYTGSRRSVRFGHGINPVGYREYRKGDDFKLVDWKVYGRTEKLFVREHEEERSLMVHILLDASGSMDFSGKFSFAARLAAGIAYLAVRENEKFSISLFANELEPGEPRRGVGNLLRSIELMEGTKPEGGTGIKKAAGQFDRLVSTTSLVVLVSDFLDEIEDVEVAIFKLSRHDLILIHVEAPQEADLNLAGDVRILDAETNKHLITRIDQRERDLYQARRDAHVSRIASVCSSVSVPFFTFRSDGPVFEAFLEMMRAGSLQT